MLVSDGEFEPDADEEGGGESSDEEGVNDVKEEKEKNPERRLRRVNRRCLWRRS